LGVVMNMASSWRDLLYGPYNLTFDPKKTLFEDFLPKPEEAPEEAAPTEPSPGGGEGGGSDYFGMSDYERELAQRHGTPNITDPAFWGGMWSPDIGWKDVAKAYGPYIGNPLTSGMRMVKDFMNPTKDPLVQKALSQYLQEFAPHMTLDQVLKEINMLYAANPASKVNALDTIAGYAMGLGPLSQQYQSAVLSGIMAPHQFAQQTRAMGWMGIDPFGSSWTYDTPTQFSTDPATGKSTYSAFEMSPIQSLTQAYLSNKQGGTLGRSVYNSYQNQYTTVGEMLTDAAAEIQRSQFERELSREWMGDILSGRTESDFGSWKESIGDRFGGDSSGGFGGTSPSAPQSGFGHGWQGGYRGEYGSGWDRASMENQYGEGGSDGHDHDSGFSDAPGGNMEGGYR
jgi:hypothetical protein